MFVCGGYEFFADGVGCCLCGFVYVCSLVSIGSNEEVCVWGLCEKVYLDSSILDLDGDVVKFGGKGTVVH